MSYGDSEHPISLRFEAHETGGDHVEVTVRAGIAGSRALAGRLTLRRQEWDYLASVLWAAHDDVDPMWFEPDYGTFLTMDQPRPAGAVAVIPAIEVDGP